MNDIQQVGLPFDGQVKSTRYLLKGGKPEEVDFQEEQKNKKGRKKKVQDTESELDDSSTPNQVFSSTHTQSRLAGHMRQVWERNRRAKLNITDRLLYCLRTRRGEYSQSELQGILNNGGADPVFLKLTGTKCRAASSWVRDIIVPAGDRPWSLEPTHEPEFPPELQKKILNFAYLEFQQLVQMGVTNPSPVDFYEFTQRVRKKAKDQLQNDAQLAVEAMEDRISQCMDVGNWDNALEEFIEDFVTYPTAFLKGPYYKTINTIDWAKGADKAMRPIIKKETQLHWTRISPFDIYPSPHARNLHEGDLIERLRLTREKLYSMIGMKGYNEKEIRHVLDEFQRGTIKDWIWEEFERERLESDSTYFTAEPDTIDGLHYWGAVKGEWLVEWGIDPEGIDPEKPYEVDAILIGNRVIRAVINDDPLGMRPFHFACWDAVPSSIWGVSLPEQMEDHQKIVNATARSLMDNLAVASGPQVVVKVDLLAENEDVTSVFPMKIWQMKSTAMGGVADKPVEFFQPAINSGELINIINVFEQKTDDVTNVPRYSYGNEKVGGAGTTASGLSMLMNSAAKGIRRAISHIDANVIRPSVHQSFIYLMMNDPDPSIKGPCKVVPRGAAALLIKDQTQVRYQSFLQLTSNPIDMNIIGIVGRAKMLKHIAKFMDLPDDIVPEPEDIEFQQNQQKMMSIEQQQNQQALQQQAMQPQGAPSSAPSAPQTPPMQQGGPNMSMGLGNESQMQQNSLPGSNQGNPG